MVVGNMIRRQGKGGGSSNFCMICGTQLRGQKGKFHPKDGSCKGAPRPASKHAGSKKSNKKRRKKS